MVKIPLAVFGSGGHAKVIIDSIEKQGRYRVAAVVDPFSKAKDFFSYPVLAALPSDIAEGVVAMGDNALRAKLAAEILKNRPDFKFAVIVHPSASIARDVEIGAGSVVMGGVCINTSTQIGKHCIINTRSSVDHDGKIGDFSSIGPGVVVGGGVTVGNFSAIGLGAACIHRTTIGEQTVIGAGATVVRDIGSFVVAYGNPCRVVRERKAGDKYL